MKSVCVALALTLVPVQQVLAQAPATQSPAGPVAATSQAPTDGRSAYDRLWERFTILYDNAAHSVVQRILFSGRFQHEFVRIAADQGDHHEWNTRRLRVGPRVSLFRDYTVHVEAELNPQEINPLYVRLTDAYVQWSRSGTLVITIGKQSMPYTMDGGTSSKELLTIDRSNLANNIWFPQEYLPGLSVSGRVAPWVYRVGLYSAGAANKEFGTFEGGAALLVVLGRDFARPLGVKEALLAANYVHQTEDSDNSFTRQLGDILSINFKLETDRWGMRADVSTAAAYLAQSDLWGVTAMPYLNVTDKFQVIGRYTFLRSDRPNGVQLATYENRVVGGRGDRYNELYVGANYFFYGHKLKLQTGLQLAEMADGAGDGGEYSGRSWTSGLRIGW